MYGFAMKKSVYASQYRILRDLLVKAREKSGATQHQIAKKLARPQSYVSKYESGERYLDVVEFIQVCEALGINPEKIIHNLQQLLRPKDIKK